MPYVDYNISLYRTGFRPYGTTNPWSASQLNGMSGMGRGTRPFMLPGGGARLSGANRVAVPWNVQRSFSPRFLHGLGQACDPTDIFGGCYSPLPMPPTPAPSPTTTDACAGPNPPLFCAPSSFPAGSGYNYPSNTPTTQLTPSVPTTYTPPIMSYAQYPAGVSPAPGPSPRVTTSVAGAAQTQPIAATATSFMSQTQFGIPNWAWLAVAAALILGGGAAGGSYVRGRLK